MMGGVFITYFLWRFPPLIYGDADIKLHYSFTEASVSEVRAGRAAHTGVNIV